jgi:hypothetical protein
MRQRPLLFTFLFLLAAAGPASAADPAAADSGAHDDAPSPVPEKTSLAGTIAFPMDTGHGQPIVDVMLDGKGPFKFYLDTGAGATVLNDDLAKELGLAILDSTRLGDPANPRAIRADVVRLASIELGGARFEGVRAVSWDRSTLRPGPDSPRGVLGVGVFAEVLLALDYPKGEVRLTRGALPAADGDRVLDYAAPMGIPVVPVRLGGRTFQAHLDSGSPASFMIPLAWKDSVRLAGEPVEMGRGRSANSTMVIFGAQLADTMHLGGHRFPRPMIQFNDALPDPNLGGRILREFVVTLDQANRRVRFDRTGKPEPSAGLMVRMAPGGGGLEIMDAREGSAAAKAGLVKGDRIVAIGGKALADIPPADVIKALRTSPLRLTVRRDESERDVELTF